MRDAAASPDLLQKSRLQQFIILWKIATKMLKAFDKLLFPA